MKNSASNSSITQASSAQQVLKEQSAPLLPALTAALVALDYTEVCHQRISQQRSTKTTVYQGLTRTQHPKFGSVIIKWELSGSGGTENFSGLNHEKNILTDLEKSQKTNNNPMTIAPPLLAYETLRVSVLNLNQHLTILGMPYYSQGSVAHYLQQPVTDKQKYQLIVQAADLIANLHHSGWLHNDIKPSNILLDSFLSNNADNGITMPKLLLTDFALAQHFDNAVVINAAGTPAYLAPERWQGQGATQQSDIYAFGIMIYEMLTGKRPFKIAAGSSDSLREWAIEHCQKPIPKLPIEYQHYQATIDKTLAKRVEKRYKSMEEVLMDLERL